MSEGFSDQDLQNVRDQLAELKKKREERDRATEELKKQKEEAEKRIAAKRFEKAMEKREAIRRGEDEKTAEKKENKKHTPTPEPEIVPEIKIEPPIEVKPIVAEKQESTDIASPKKSDPTEILRSQIDDAVQAAMDVFKEFQNERELEIVQDEEEREGVDIEKGNLSLTERLALQDKLRQLIKDKLVEDNKKKVTEGKQPLFESTPEMRKIALQLGLQENSPSEMAQQIAAINKLEYAKPHAQIGVKEKVAQSVSEPTPEIPKQNNAEQEPLAEVEESNSNGNEKLPEKTKEEKRKEATRKKTKNLFNNLREVGKKQQNKQIENNALKDLILKALLLENKNTDPILLNKAEYIFNTSQEAGALDKKISEMGNALGMSDSELRGLARKIAEENGLSYTSPSDMIMQSPEYGRIQNREEYEAARGPKDEYIDFEETLTPKKEGTEDVNTEWEHMAANIRNKMPQSAKDAIKKRQEDEAEIDDDLEPTKNFIQAQRMLIINNLNLLDDKKIALDKEQKDHPFKHFFGRKTEKSIALEKEIERIKKEINEDKEQLAKSVEVVELIEKKKVKEGREKTIRNLAPQEKILEGADLKRMQYLATENFESDFANAFGLQGIRRKATFSPEYKAAKNAPAIAFWYTNDLTDGPEKFRGKMRILAFNYNLTPIEGETIDEFVKRVYRANATEEIAANRVEKRVA